MSIQRSTLLRWIQIAGLTVVVSGSATAHAASTERQLEQLQIRMERLERASDNQGVFEMQRQMNSMDQEIQDLRGELERLRFELDEIKAHQREMFIAVDKRLKEFGDRPAQVRRGRCYRFAMPFEYSLLCSRAITSRAFAQIADGLQVTCASSCSRQFSQ